MPEPAKTEERTRNAKVEHVEAYRFRLEFGGGIPDIMADEPAPLGEGKGPNAGSLLAAAIGNCLSASLMLCLKKSHVEVTAMDADVTLTLGRNEAGRLRVARGDVRLALSTPADAPVARCLGIFEDYCIVTATVRQAFPIDVVVVDAAGRELHRSAMEAAARS